MKPVEIVARIMDKNNVAAGERHAYVGKSVNGSRRNKLNITQAILLDRLLISPFKDSLYSYAKCNRRSREQEACYKNRDLSDG